MISALRSLSLSSSRRASSALSRISSPSSAAPTAAVNANNTIFSDGSLISSGKSNNNSVLQESLGAVRHRWTRAKKKRHARYLRRQEMAAQGIPVPKPPMWMDPKTTVVVNGIPREEQRRIVAERRQSQHLNKPVLKEGANVPPPLLLPFHNSYHETDPGLQMSEKVAKVLALTNGNQRRAVQAQKAAGMKLFQMRPGDTGSSAVQIIALTARIQQLQTHLLMHPKDKSGKRRAEMVRVRRRKLLDYLEREDFESYAKVVTTLGLR